MSLFWKYIPVISVLLCELQSSHDSTGALHGGLSQVFEVTDIIWTGSVLKMNDFSLLSDVTDSHFIHDISAQFSKCALGTKIIACTDQRLL